MRALALLLAALLAGCLGGADEPAAAPSPSPPTPEAANPPGGSTNRSADLLPVGRAWTYEGDEFYNPEKKWTVVVAQAGPDGYLFAGGGTEAELVYDAIWEGWWYGERDLHTNRKTWELRPLDLPLHDGKTWELREGYTLTARATELATPLGSLPGFVVEGKGSEAASFRGEYAPQIGNWVKLEIVWASGIVGESVRLTSVKDNAKWIWYETSPIARSGGPDEPAQLDVTSGYDNVIVSAGGISGGRVVVHGPGGSWNTEFTGEEDWHQTMMTPTEGKWVGQAVSRPSIEGAPALPLGWSHVSMAAVKWIRP